MINGKTFEHRPISELMSIVKDDLPKFDAEGLIDTGKCVKVIMACNDKLGITVREIREACVPVEEYKAQLPLNFEKLYYMAAVKATNAFTFDYKNPFDNKFDRDIIYDAHIDRESLGGADNYNVTIKRKTKVTVHPNSTFTTLDVAPSCHSQCHPYSPHFKRKGKYTVTINDGFIETPFRCGEIYIMYLGTMEDAEGNLLFPFHPLITPYYEWAIKEKILTDAVYNSEGDYGGLLKDARMEKTKAWLDAFNITTEKGFGEYVDLQKKKELMWYNQYFKYFQ